MSVPVGGPGRGRIRAVGDTVDDVVMSQGEARTLVLASLATAPFFILTCVAFQLAYASDTMPGAAALVGFAGMVALGGVMEPARRRIRKRSGMSTWFPRARDDLRIMRTASASCGWPARVVGAALVIATAVCAVSFLRFLVPFMLEGW